MDFIYREYMTLFDAETNIPYSDTDINRKIIKDLQDRHFKMTHHNQNDVCKEIHTVILHLSTSSVLKLQSGVLRKKWAFE